jgi:hypothetical protein
MRLNIAIPEDHVTKPVLDAALEAVSKLDEQMIQSGESPTSLQLIDQGAIWQPEKPGQEHFDHGGLIAGRGHGDCDDWAPLHAATLRVTGRDPGAKAVVRKSGPKRWHAVVLRSDGSIDDPSLAAGMPGRGRQNGVSGAALPMIFAAPSGRHGVDGTVGAYIATPQLALRPIKDRHGQVEAWQARADLPWHWHPTGTPADLAMVSLHRSPVSSQAIVGAVRGAFRVGLCNGADPETLKRLSAISDACEGCTWEELARDYGPEHATAAGNLVGSFFGKAFRAIKKVASPLVKGALSVVPGGGAVKAAFDMASPLLKRNVKKGAHKPPAATAAVLAVRPAAQRAPSGGGGQGFSLWCAPR